MNKIALALTAAAFALSTGVAFAENPNFGIPKELQPTPSGQYSHRAPTRDSYGAPSVNLDRLQNGGEYVNPAANRYGDAAPRN